MDRYWQNVRCYVPPFLWGLLFVDAPGAERGVHGRTYMLALMALVFLAGCSGKGREEISPSLTLSAGETVREGGIVIEIVSSTEGEEIQETDKGAQGESDIDLEILRPDQVYSGEILRKEDVEMAGEDNFFTCSPISDSVFCRMDGNSYKAGCPVSREDLRYLRILHYDFSGNIRVGELVCNQSVSGDMTRIFRELYKAGYPIEKVVLIDDYGGDDDLSSQDNNTSCFNYRTVAGSDNLSLHALGVAIDVNPLYNPYITWNAQGELNCAPSNGAAYVDRSRDFPYKIDEDDLCCRLFTQAGFTWGGSWEGHQDYMHFSRGSRPET